MKTHTLTIAPRFHGPPQSGNGGYVCGQLARFIDGPSAIVRLHQPPPLSTDLEVRGDSQRATLLAGETLVAEAHAAVMEELEPVEPVGYEEAERASRDFVGFESHWFPSCFVCGPDRTPGDGLCIFPGPIAGSDRVAAPWIPDASLASADDSVAPEFLWAALDCPGAFSFPQPAGAILLGQLQVALMGTVSVGERCVLVAREIEHRGRKHRTVTSLHGEGGDCRGVGVGTWIEVAKPV